jgi:transposase-like protein
VKSIGLTVAATASQLGRCGFRYFYTVHFSLSSFSVSHRRCCANSRIRNSVRNESIWRELLEQLKRQGLSTAPKLAVGDGSLGFWLALQEGYGPVAQQRCWVHKTANILDKMAKSVQGRAKQLIHEMYLAPTRKAALAAYDQFMASYQAKFPKGTECLEKDKQWLFTFYDFPAQHWSHLRTTNPIESTFATVRLRTQRTKGCSHRRAEG